jgi:hypothetical protein
MKQVFKCDYCNFIGDEEQVKTHEPVCMDNYDRKSCYTCTNRNLKSLTQFGCDCGKEIPEGHIFEFCDKYEQKEKRDYYLSNIFGDLFGGK